MSNQPKNSLPHKPLILRLKINMAGTEYVISDLSFNVRENQFYYLLNWPSESSDSQKYLNENRTTSRVNKISFHKDSMHIKVEAEIEGKQLEKKLERIERKFLPSDNQVKLLFVESFVLEGNPASILATSTNLKSRLKPDHEKVISILPDVIDFGLILLLVPSTISVDDVMFNSIIEYNDFQIPLSNFKKENHTIGRITAFDGYDMVIFTTPYAHKIDSSTENMPQGPSRILNYTEPLQSLVKIIKDNNNSL